MTVTAVRSVLVGVSNLERALVLFRDTMGLREEFDRPVPIAQLRAWGRDDVTSARMVELSGHGHAFGRLRLVQFHPPARSKVRVDAGPGAPDGPLDIGPKAIDFYVRDPIDPALEVMLAAGCIARSPPRKHQIGKSISEEVVLTGPDDVPILIMVGHRHAPTSLRPGSPEGQFSEIATSSVICADIEASRAFYGGALGLVPVNDAETPPEYRDLVDELVSAPAGTRVHFLLYAQRGEASGKILLVHFYGASTRRLTGRMRPGHLGFSLFAHETDDIEDLATRLTAAGAKIECRPSLTETVAGTRSMMLVRGPNEEMFEFTQTVGAARRP
jgi:catechol 2,3-dioxygenase-like lactoylglutathione lyase family enzyme